MFEINTGLQYVTSENTSEGFSAKVFCGFCPGNYIIAKEIMQDIISACDCTVFYYKQGAPADSDPDYKNDLAQMSVFIPVVTPDYLFSPSFARDVLYPYAVEQMIPVVPIVTVPGLEQDFQNFFGNSQFVLWHAEQYDITSIPYPEKLKNHLNQVLRMDMDRKTLREAFDTGIFLSYRKKDRYYAQKLMKMIHEDARCQGISIWYDEFLIPGEDFNQNIRQELEDSSMMILAVTPHITEKDNYIILTEYPTAVELQKRILLFEMCPTSRAELDAVYENLPALVPAQDSSLIHHTILSAAKKLGIKPIATSAEKDYLRGLAYLKGVCVEKNTELGVQKITASAQMGVPQAMHTLSSIYKNGEGIAHSPENAALWQEKYIETLLHDYTLDVSTGNARSLIDAYFELGGLYEQSSRLSSAIEIYREVEKLCENAPSLAEFNVNAKIKAGSLYMRLGDYLKAQHGCFGQAIDILEAQRRGEATLETALNLCRLYALLAECCQSCRNMADAKEYTIRLRDELKSIADLQALKTGGFSAFSRFTLCKSKLAHLYVELFTRDANQIYITVGEAIEAAEELVRISDCYTSRLNLLSAHMYNGDQHIRQNQPNHFRCAETAYGCAQQILTQLAEKYGDDFELQQLDARLLQKQGFVKQGLGDPETARKLYRDALERCRLLYLRQNTVTTRKNLYDCLRETGVLYQHCGEDTKACEDVFTEAAVLAHQNIADNPLAAYKKDAAEIHNCLAVLYQDQWDADNAFAHTASQVELLRQVVQETKRVGDLRLFASALVTAAKTADFSGEFETAKVWRQELADMYAQYRIFLS